MSATLELGMIVPLNQDVEQEFGKVADLGMTTCQLSPWAPDTLDRSLADKVRAASNATGVAVSSYWTGHSGRTVWDFVEGPTTIGLVPAQTRDARLVELNHGSDFAAMINAPSVTTHISGDEQIVDIRKAIDVLGPLV